MVLLAVSKLYNRDKQLTETNFENLVKLNVQYFKKKREIEIQKFNSRF